MYVPSSVCMYYVIMHVHMYARSIKHACVIFIRTCTLHHARVYSTHEYLRLRSWSNLMCASYRVQVCTISGRDALAALRLLRTLVRGGVVLQ